MQIKFNYNEFYINKKFQFNYNTHLSCYTTFSQTNKKKSKAKQNIQRKRKNRTNERTTKKQTLKCIMLHINLTKRKRFKLLINRST